MPRMSIGRGRRAAASDTVTAAAQRVCTRCQTALADNDPYELLPAGETGWEAVVCAPCAAELEEAELDAAAVEVDESLLRIGEMTSGYDPLTQAAIDAWAEPMDDPVLTAAVEQVLAAADSPIGEDSLASALAALASSHKATVDGIAVIVASAVAQRPQKADEITLAALSALEKLALRPAPPAAPAPVVNVHVPEREMTVNVEAAPAAQHHIDVHVPQQDAPVVNVDVAAPDAPVVNVEVAAPDAQPVVVNVPQQQAPVVHVHPAPPQAAKKMRVQENPVTGERTFVFDEPDE